MSTTKLPKSWPPTAREVLLEAARYYYREMKNPWPVPDVIMDRAIVLANRLLEERDREIREEAGPRWIDRWEAGRLDDEMRRAIQETYRRMSRGERAIRPRARAKKLEADIAESLARRQR